MKRVFKIFLLSTLVIVSPFSAFAGAVSAGGMMAPAKFECLFQNPRVPFQVLNFVIFNVSDDLFLAPAQLEAFDWGLNKIIWTEAFLSPVVQSNETLRVYLAESETKKNSLEVEMNLARPATDDQVRVLFKGIFQAQNTSLVEGVLKYESRLKFEGQWQAGFCSEQYFIFYGN